MQVQFETVLFDSEDFLFAVVDATSLVIKTSKAELIVAFDSHEEALSAQLDLGEILDDAKGSNSVTGLFQEVSSLVSGLFGGVVDTVSAKARKAGAAATTQKVDVEARAQDMIDTITEALRGSVRAGRDTVADAESVFGNGRSAAKTAVSADSVVSDLTDAELTSAIDDKVAHLMANDARVIALVDNVRRFHGDDEVAGAVANHKSFIFDTARNNAHLTVNQVFNEILRGL